MTDEELLVEIKNRLSVTGNYHDELLINFAQDVKAFMRSAGVSDEVIESEKSIGLIAKGVNDLWTSEKFSELFNQRLIQLTMEKVDV